MTIHSSILAWRIPWTEELGGLWSMGSQGVRHNGASNTVTFLTPSHFPDGKRIGIPVHYQRVSPLGLPCFLADMHKGDGSPADLLLSSLTTSLFRHLSGFCINGQHPCVSMCIVVLLIVVHQAET